MRPRSAWAMMLFLPASLAAGPVFVESDPTAGPPPGYERRTIEGFTVNVNKAVFQHPVDRWGRQPLSVLTAELNDLRRLLLPKIFNTLQHKVPVWVEWDEKFYPYPDRRLAALARYRQRPYAEGWGDREPEKRAEEWRKTMTKLNPKAGSIEVCSLSQLSEARQPGSARQQVMLLHEMAHAVHDRLVGWKNPDLLAAFQQAVDRKLYDDVTDRSRRRTRAYARTNDMEYFAEISCAYLDSCNYFPFNYAQLQAHDPVGFAFVERVWKHPEQFQEGGSKAAASAPTFFSERAAQLKLDRLRAMANEGSKDEVKKGLQELVRNSPGTAAADEARKLLKSLD